MGATVWISHRGYKAHAAENTLQAFRDALSQGFSVLETDLRLSQDGHIVLHHDPDLRRTAGTSGVIARMTRDELAKVRLSDGSPLLFWEGFAVEFAHCSWVLDVKPETGRETLVALKQWAKERSFESDLVRRARFLVWRKAHEDLLLSLWPEAVSYARELECWRAGLSALARLPVLGDIKRGRTYSLPPRLRGLRLYKESMVRPFHDRGARVLAFLPESTDDARAALMAGVDEILTNNGILSEV